MDWISHRAMWPFFPLLFFLVLSACSSQSLTLVHPQSGATVKCAATGSGIMAGWVEGLMEECAQGYEKQGYVPVNKLTPQQRADLERRGLLPQE